MWARYIGYWKSDNHPTFIDPKYIMGTWREEKRASIIAYLQSGRIFCDHLQLEQCIICKYETKRIDLTDGLWIWPSILVHYIQEHNILMPPDVEKELARRNFQMPEYKGVLEVSWIYWETYCDFMQGKSSKDYRK